MNNRDSLNLLWSILDLFVRIITMLVVVVILSRYLQDPLLTFFILLFIIWAFRPFILDFKNFLSLKNKKGIKR